MQWAGCALIVQIAEALAALDESGLCLPSISLDDVSISSVDGTLKLGKSLQSFLNCALTLALAAHHAVPWADGRSAANSVFLELLSEMQSSVSGESLTLRKLSSWATKCSDSNIAKVLNVGNELVTSGHVS